MSTAIQIQEARSLPIFPTAVEWNMLKEQAAMVVKTGFLPKAIDTPEKAIAIALKGRELGIPMMQAFAHIHVIQGKPCISSELMLALIFKNCHGAVVNYISNELDKCVIQAKRPGGRDATFSFTIEEARKAGLLNKDSWKNYPGAMLRARAVAIVARALFADAIMGCSYTPEEMGAEVDDEGEVINIPNDPNNKFAGVTGEDARGQSGGKSTPQAATNTLPATIAPQEPKKPVVIRTKNSVGNEILAVAEELNLAEAELNQWACENSGKATTSEMTLGDLENFLAVLQKEL